jgi:hypothetical protein
MVQKYFILILTAFLFASCERPDLIKPAGFETVISADSIMFAQIGDFGYSGEPEKEVADLVKSWNPDFIISAGDNNYAEGKYSTLKANISNYYGDYIYNFDAPAEYQCHGRAATEHVNRFFPTPGNHDAASRDGLIPYYNFFTLPETEVYYKFTWGPVTFFSVNCINDNLEEQRTWLESECASCTSPFKVVFFHYPPYCSGSHGNTPEMQWDFYSMGIDLVFSGHDHVYERLEKKGEEGMYFIVNGVGGKAVDNCGQLLDAGTFNDLCHGGYYGAVKCKANSSTLTVEFYTVNDPLHAEDRFQIRSLNESDNIYLTE